MTQAALLLGDKTLKGKEAVRQYMKSTYIEPPKFVVDQLIAEGDFVTAIGEIDITDETGKTVHSAYCDVWRVRDGMLAELRAFVVEIKEMAKTEDDSGGLAAF